MSESTCSTSETELGCVNCRAPVNNESELCWDCGGEGGSKGGDEYYMPLPCSICKEEFYPDCELDKLCDDCLLKEISSEEE